MSEVPNNLPPISTIRTQQCSFLTQTRQMNRAREAH